MIPTIIDIGVPRVTVLGLLLFVIYINDIFSICFEIFIENYWATSEPKMNHYLGKLNDYFSSNRLTLNTKKTEHMTFGYCVDSVPADTNISLNQFRINRTKSVKYLGIHIDYKLK